MRWVPATGHPPATTRMRLRSATGRHPCWVSGSATRARSAWAPAASGSRSP